MLERKQLKKKTLLNKKQNYVSTAIPLQLLHIDLFGTTRMLSLGGKKHGLIIVYDY